MKRYFSGLFGLFAFSPFADALPQEGQWRFQVSYELLGIPQQEFKGYTIEQCLSPEDPVPHIERHGECSHTPHQGKTPEPLRWFVDCSSEEEMVHGQGRLRFNGKRAEGDLYMQVLDAHNPPMAMAFHIKGQLQGACPR